LKATKQDISSNQLQHTTKKTNQCKCRVEKVPEKKWNIDFKKATYVFYEKFR